MELNYLAFDQIGTTVAVIVVALAFTVLVWNAVKAIRDLLAMAAKPTSDKLRDHEERISHLEEFRDEAREKLEGDWRFRQEEVEFNNLMLRSIKHLIQHEVDGNDTKALQQMEAEIDKWLFDHSEVGRR